MDADRQIDKYTDRYKEIGSHTDGYTDRQA